MAISPLQINIIHGKKIRIDSGQTRLADKTIPLPLLVKIFSYLPFNPQEYSYYSLVSKTWNSLSKESFKFDFYILFAKDGITLVVNSFSDHYLDKLSLNVVNSLEELDNHYDFKYFPNDIQTPIIIPLFNQLYVFPPVDNIDFTRALNARPLYYSEGQKIGVNFFNSFVKVYITDGQKGCICQHIELNPPTSLVEKQSKNNIEEKENTSAKRFLSDLKEFDRLKLIQLTLKELGLNEKSSDCGVVYHYQPEEISQSNAKNKVTTFFSSFTKESLNDLKDFSAGACFNRHGIIIFFLLKNEMKKLYWAKPNKEFELCHSYIFTPVKGGNEHFSLYTDNHDLFVSKSTNHVLVINGETAEKIDNEAEALFGLNFQYYIDSQSH